MNRIGSAPELLIAQRQRRFVSAKDISLHRFRRWGESHFRITKKIESHRQKVFLIFVVTD